MQLNQPPFRAVRKYARQYRSRLARMSMEALRGVVRGWVFRHRALSSAGVKRSVHRQVHRALALYEHRFGTDAFATETRHKLSTSLPGRNWLPGGYAHWRTRIAGDVKACGNSGKEAKRYQVEEAREMLERLGIKP